MTWFHKLYVRVLISLHQWTARRLGLVNFPTTAALTREQRLAPRYSRRIE